MQRVIIPLSYKDGNITFTSYVITEYVLRPSHNIPFEGRCQEFKVIRSYKGF
jgi:hypothetical protein